MVLCARRSGWGLETGWNGGGKADVHYFCQGHVKDREEILHMRNSLGEMFRYFLFYIITKLIDQANGPFCVLLAV